MPAAIPFLRMRAAIMLALCLTGTALPGPLHALTLPDGSVLASSQQSALGSFRVATGPWRDGALPLMTVAGTLDQTAWQIDWPVDAAAVPTASAGPALVTGTGMTGSGAAGGVLRTTGAADAPGTTPADHTTLAMIADLRDQAIAEGYRVLFECETDACGGFDFRYGLDLLPEPEMHVDLGDFRYLSLQSGSGDNARYLAVMVSRSRTQGHVQISSVTPATGAADGGAPSVSSKSPAALARSLADVQLPDETDAAPSLTASATEAEQSVAPQAEHNAATADTLLAALQSGDSVPLEDLSFAPGSSTLAAGTYASLATLADYLDRNPQSRLLLIGHSDATGSQASNEALSRLRAQSVADRLHDEFRIAATRITADGQGFAAPRDTNDTDAGRARNRRVEAMLTPTP